MGLRAWTARLAAAAPAPVFCVTGGGAAEAVQDLALDPRLELVNTPRRATVLLLAGDLSPAFAGAAAAAHDAMAQPRATIAWPAGTAADPVASPFVDVSAVAGGRDEAAAALAACHEALLRGQRAFEPALLPDADPNPWRGEGPYGQGGTGMTGGVPYGRPMPGRADDRDGLTLDELRLTMGPLLAPLPPGLTFDVALHGDVLAEVSLGGNPFDGHAGIPASLEAFHRAVREPVGIAELELARARRHLRWLARALTVHGLDALGRRALRLAVRLTPADGPAVAALERSVRRSQVLSWATAGVGVVNRRDAAAAAGGPTARAAGCEADARADDPAYRDLGFEPVRHEAGDASTRWRQRLAETRQALDLAGRAGDVRAGGRGRVEAPTGPLETDSAPTSRMLQAVPNLVTGQEWGDAVTTLTSVDLDLEEAATRRQPAPREPAS